MAAKSEEIIHIFVIGFHHKKGCQIEFSYPELKILPEAWKSLPSLAMPDGAHNFDSDAVYFHLPSLDDCKKTIFGVSCFKQIPVEKVKKKTSDMTRGAVQKAVCVLSTVPLYGYLQIKMDLVTAAFFEGDFSEVSLLKDAFHHLNGCLPLSYMQHLHDGLSIRDLVQCFRHRTILLFKLMLLEKKVVFFHSPVKPLCCFILSLISLHPGVIRKGLFESTCLSNINSVDRNNYGQTTPGSEQIEHRNSNSREHQNSWIGDTCNVQCGVNDCDISFKESCKNKNEIEEQDAKNLRTLNSREESAKREVDVFFMDDYCSSLKNLENVQLEQDLQKNEDSNTGFNCDLSFMTNLNLESYGLPLSIFSNGNLCLPYVSITYLDYLSGENVRGFVGGAANVLFKQKRQFADVLVELEGSKIETHCPELRKQLLLTTEDLRFGEQLIKGLELDSTDKNGDDWFRSQFTLYILSLLRTSLLQDGSKEIDHFNTYFVNAWKNTKNYETWLASEHNAIWDINPGHPCAGNLSVADMRLRLSQVMSSSESGRRINQAVTTTGKAVGGAITQAKGALSHWWSSLTTSDTKNGKPVENI